jgi:hypothetical protein
MADVQPLRALHYDQSVAGPLQDLVAPPYDVIDPPARAALQARSRHNVVAIDLPEAPEGGDPYAAAAATLDAWIAEGAVVQDPEPAIWALVQDYTAPDGRKLTLVAEGQRLLLLHKGRRVVLERAAAADRFIVRHPDFELFPLAFARAAGVVTEAFHGGDWYAGARYAGPREFDHPKEWEAFVGHYHSDSPWYGDARVVLRKGRLWLGGLQPLVPRGDGLFGINDPEAPDRVGFESIVAGRAMRANYSGIVFRRTFTP